MREAAEARSDRFRALIRRADRFARFWLGSVRVVRGRSRRSPAERRCPLGVQSRLPTAWLRREQQALKRPSLAGDRLPRVGLLPALVLGAAQAGLAVPPPQLVLRGGTVLDVSGLGRSSNDLRDAEVVVEGSTIVKVGLRGGAPIPPGAEVLDVSGKFILPGLVDGFAALNNQAYADAYLAMGVTTIVGVGGGRRGDLYTEADPGPAVVRLESVGHRPLSDAELVAALEALAGQGVKVALLMYQLRPAQIELAVRTAGRLGLATIGELGHATYEQALGSGVAAFVHTTRYSLDAAPRDLASAVAEQPFSDELQSPKWRYYKYLTQMDLEAPAFVRHAERLGAGRAFLIPTLSLLYLDLPDPRNLWNEPVAAILDEKDINNPADRTTGRHSHDAEHQEAYTRLGLKELEIEKRYVKAGARYLAGSGTDVWGTMPGISLHTELELLARIGLSRREALAAASSNFEAAFGWKGLGQVKPGYRADLVVVDADPLADLENLKKVHRVVLGGRVLDPARLLRR